MACCINYSFWIFKWFQTSAIHTAENQNVWNLEIPHTNNLNFRRHIFCFVMGHKMILEYFLLPNEHFSFGPPLETMKKSCLKELKFSEFQKILNPAFAENFKSQKLVNPLVNLSSYFLFGIPL